MISVLTLSKYPEAKRTFSSPMASLPPSLLDRKYEIKSFLLYFHLTILCLVCVGFNESKLKNNGISSQYNSFLFIKS